MYSENLLKLVDNYEKIYYNLTQLKTFQVFLTLNILFIIFFILPCFIFMCPSRKLAHNYRLYCREIHLVRNGETAGSRSAVFFLFLYKKFILNTEKLIFSA